MGSLEEVGVGFSLALNSGWGKNEKNSEQREHLGQNHGSWPVQGKSGGKSVDLEYTVGTGWGCGRSGRGVRLSGQRVRCGVL